MQRPVEVTDSDRSVLRYVALRSGRIALWWCVAEYMIHVMYMHSIQSNETYLEILPPWALGKVIFRVHFFFCLTPGVLNPTKSRARVFSFHFIAHVYKMQSLRSHYPHWIY